MTNRPEFDPGRKAGIRDMLVATVAADAQGGAAKNPRRTKRTIAVVAIAVLVGILASGTVAVALTGGSLFGLPQPAVTTVAPTPTAPATSTPTPRPTPTATPTAPPNPPAPIVRVPATCDDLLPQSAAESLMGLALGLPPEFQFSNPLFYTDRRVGSLSCRWSDDSGTEWNSHSNSVDLEIVPGVTPEGFRGEAEREGGYISSPEPALGPDVYSSCGPGTGYCGFIALVNGYAISLGAQVGGGTMSDEQRAELRDLLIGSWGSVAALAEPLPLWEPSGAGVAGADSCDELIDRATLSSQLGVADIDYFKREAGEYANGHFGSPAQVHAYYCSWTTIDGSASVGAAVLPGGSSYFAESAAADPEVVWEPAPDYPGEAYLHQAGAGDEVTILIDGAWVRISAPADKLRGIVDIVLANVGAQ